MPDFIDGIDDFQKARWLHNREKRQVTAQKTLAEQRVRAQERQVWQDQGRGALQSLNKSFGGIEGILGPHRDHKLYVQQLDSFADELAKRPTGGPYCYSKRLLEIVRPPTHVTKVDLVLHWWAVMCEMRRGKDTFLRQEVFQGKMPNILRALRIRERGERSRIPIAVELLADLKAKRTWKRKTLAEIKLIRDTRSKHHQIPDCKSLLHLTPAGGPVCGVVHIGGSSNVVQYVRSVHRQTGVTTLQTLEHELQALDEEEREAEEKLATANVGIEALEKVLFIHSRDTFQAWWPCVLAKWRALRAAIRMNWSTWFFRIRRMVKMKRLIDKTAENELDFDYLLCEFSDVRDALEEYLSKIQGQRAVNAEFVAKRFLSNLRTAVAMARKKEYLRQERIKAEASARDFALSSKKKAYFLMTMRKRVQIIERRKFVCIRPRCCGRRFASEDRYNTHMGLHRLEDDLRVAKLTAASRRWEERVVKEEQCMARVVEARRNIVADTLRELAEPKSAEEILKQQVANRLASLGIGGGMVAAASVPDSGTEEQLEARLALIQEAIRRDGDPAFAEKTPWTAAGLPHLRVANAELNTTMFHLEIVSMSGDVQASERIALNKALVRIGTLPELECSVVATGAVKRDAQLAKVHCMIYSPYTADADAGLVIVDNHTRYGTYVVSERAAGGAAKVSTVVTEGTPLVPGDLLCIGVRKNGGPMLTAVEASGAAIVYRVRCSEREGPA